MGVWDLAKKLKKMAEEGLDYTLEAASSIEEIIPEEVKYVSKGIANKAKESIEYVGSGIKERYDEVKKTAEIM